MKNVLTLLLILFMALAAGCIFGNDDDDDDKDTNKGSGKQAADYFPLQANATWTYNLTGTNFGTSVQGTNTTTITGTEEKDGTTYMVFSGSDGTNLLRIENNVVYKYYQEWFWMGLLKSAPEPVAAKAARSHQSLSGEAPVFNFDKSSWTVWSHSETYDGKVSNTTVTGKYLGTSHETVAGKSYQDVVKFEITQTSHYEGAHEWQSVKVYWLAPGVGVIYQTTYESHPGGTDNIDTQLTIENGTFVASE